MAVIIKEKSFAFAIRILKLNRYLVDRKKEFLLARQVLRSGTAIGALIREAQNAESKSDFIHKLSIAQKECDETLYWLELLLESNILTEAEFQSMHSEANELLKLLKSVILTTRKNLRK